MIETAFFFLVVRLLVPPPFSQTRNWKFGGEKEEETVKATILEEAMFPLLSSNQCSVSPVGWLAGLHRTRTSSLNSIGLQKSQRSEVQYMYTHGDSKRIHTVHQR